MPEIDLFDLAVGVASRKSLSIDLLNAVDRATPEQIQELSNKLSDFSGELSQVCILIGYGKCLGKINSMKGQL